MPDVYSDSKIFHFPDHLQSIANGEMPPPIHIRLKPTNRCNHSCSYCCYRNPELYLGQGMDESDEIPQDKMREIAADLVTMGVRAVTLSGGGEPLCYPHIEETIQALADGGIKIAMLTNGALLEGAVAELLARRAAWVRVSIDAADAETYAGVRSVSDGEFDHVCDNLRAFAEMPGRACVLGANLIVTKENSDDVLSFLQLAHELGIDHVKVSAAIVSTTPKENHDYISGFYDAVKSQIHEAQSSLTGSAFAVIDKFHYPDVSPESFERDYTWCPMARCLTVIAADMNVYTCQDKAYTPDGLLGSIRDCRFADLWTSEDLRQRLEQLDPSKDCRHHCVAHAKNLSLLDFFAADSDHLDFV